MFLFSVAELNLDACDRGRSWLLGAARFTGFDWACLVALDSMSNHRSGGAQRRICLTPF